MASINRRRVWLGGLAGGVAWVVWSLIVNMGILSARYQKAMDAGQFLAEPRYSYFMPLWIIILLFLGVVVSLLYASVRATRGPGWRTALYVGLLVGFVAGVPTNFGTASWAKIDRIFPFWWMLEMWAGAIFATLVAGWLYKEAGA